MQNAKLGVRWTIGDVSAFGFEALRFSAWGAHRIFGADAAYVVCVNSVPLDRARELAGEMPPQVTWYDASNDVPDLLRTRLDQGMAEGVAWKLAPLRYFEDLPELALDNDCILWRLPEAVRAWLEDGTSCLIAEDVRACFGQFAPWCGEDPLNSGIRGLPVGFDLEGHLEALLQANPVVLRSELDEQGMQVAALRRHGALHVVPVSDVAICSPFPPHVPHLGRSGVHCVGLNAHSLGWQLNGRPAEDITRELWRSLRPAIAQQVGVPMAAADAA